MPRHHGDDYEDRFSRDDAEDRPRERLYRADKGRERFQRERGHSVMGILSCLTALLAGVMTFTLFLVAGVMSANRGDLPEDSPEAIALGLGFFACVGLTLVAMILGVVGLFGKKDKLFPILGTSFSALILFGTILLVCAGIVAG